MTCSPETIVLRCLSISGKRDLKIVLKKKKNGSHVTTAQTRGMISGCPTEDLMVPIRNDRIMSAGIPKLNASMKVKLIRRKI
jgi:hypothetical protein